MIVCYGHKSFIVQALMLQCRKLYFSLRLFKTSTFNDRFQIRLVHFMENVRQVVVPIVAKCIRENIFYLYVSFLSHFSIKIVSQKMLILSGLSQKLVTGFFPTVSFMTDAKFLLSAMLPHSHTLFLCLSLCLPVSPSFHLIINIARVCILDY